jgi:uncharacterized protein
MKIDLSEIAGTVGMHAAQKIEQPCSPKEMGFDCTGPITGKLEISNTGTLLIITGEIETKVAFECSLCLEQFTVPVKTEIEEEFKLEKIGDAIQAIPVDEDDLNAGMVTHNILDVGELARQNLLVALPIQPICRPECKGLCPTCGENLNVGECTCPPPEHESPFAVLADLLDDDEKSSE